MFRCRRSRRCIAPQFVCDGEPDCGLADSYDEDYCTQHRKCAANEAACLGGRCLPIERFCDGHKDCENDEDPKFCSEF